MFLVPKYLVGADGQPGERNGVYATNVEHKMGLKVSTTCELTFGAEHPAIGTLVGGVHDGIRQMFMIIEYARMMVGTKAIATLSTGYLNALDYAKSGCRAASSRQMADKTAPRVTITHHPDVRRILMLQKAYAEGMRALVLYTATFQDAEQLAQAGGGHDEHAIAMNDLLLPVVKGVGSERAYEMLALSLQTLGGSGYLQDYPLEQYIRDAKIDSLYEGTTAIQGMDLYFRKIVRNQGQALATCSARSGPRRPPRRATAGSRRSGRRSPGPPTTSRRWSTPCTGTWRRASSSPARSTRSGLTPPGCCWRSATSSSAGCWSGRPRWPLPRSTVVAAAAGRHGRRQRDDTASTRARSPPPGSSPRTCCPGWPPSARSSRTTSTDLMDLPEAAF